MNECNICFDEKICFQPEYKCCVFKICSECLDVWNKTTSPVIKCPICRNKIEPIERQPTVFTTVNQIQRIEIQSIEFTTVNPIYIYIQPVREPDYNNPRSRKICGLFLCMGFLGITILLLLYPRD
jgi:hypothetical protein